MRDRKERRYFAAASGIGMARLALVHLKHERYDNALWALGYAKRDFEYALQVCR